MAGSPLTESQERVLALMLERKSHRRIARELGVATMTVARHIVNIWDRLMLPGNALYASGVFARLSEVFPISRSQKTTFCDEVNDAQVEHPIPGRM